MKIKIVVVVALFFGIWVTSPMLTHAYSNSDINQDTCVDRGDLAFLRTNFGSADSSLDFDSNGEIDSRDVSYVMHDWALCADHVDTTELYPFALGRLLKFSDRNDAGSVYEVMSTEIFGNNHFSVHHQYGSIGSEAPFCPRVDDVFASFNDQLLYTDTYSFYTPEEDPFAGLTRIQYDPGKMWLRASMKKDEWYPEVLPGNLYNITQLNCVVTSQTLKTGNTNDATKVKISDAFTTSPYTGALPVSVLHFTQLTYFNNNSDDWFQEDWYFYKDPIQNYIPIEIIITKKDLGAPNITFQSDEVLDSIY